MLMVKRSDKAPEEFTVYAIDVHRDALDLKGTIGPGQVAWVERVERAVTLAGKDAASSITEGTDAVADLRALRETYIAATGATPTITDLVRVVRQGCAPAPVIHGVFGRM